MYNFRQTVKAHRYPETPKMPGQPFKITLPLIVLSMTLYLLLLSFIQYPLTTILKPIPILLLIIFSLQVIPKGEEKILLVGALGFSLCGDIVLTFSTKTALQVGILAFMAAHCFYICLFLKSIQFQRKGLTYFLPVLTLVIIVTYFLWPYTGEMKIPVTVYICLLTLMVFCSFQVKEQPLLIGLGSFLFLFSDFILALELFVLSVIPTTKILIMLLYYVAQFLLVIGITQTKYKVFARFQGKY
jgi:uncharacterized membrane protein YhhN